MKRILCLLLVVLLLGGCASVQSELDRAMALRSRLLAQAVEFDARITADYGDKTLSFTLECQSDQQGELQFTVREPASIAGISGSVSAEGGKLRFDSEALAFGLLADGQLAPAAAPWVLMKTLRSGYLTSCTREGQFFRVSIDDSYADDALHLDIWLGEQDLPVRGEILWKGRRILTVSLENFRFL